MRRAVRMLGTGDAAASLRWPGRGRPGRGVVMLMKDGPSRRGEGAHREERRGKLGTQASLYTGISGDTVRGETFFLPGHWTASLAGYA